MGGVKTDEGDSLLEAGPGVGTGSRLCVVFVEKCSLRVLPSSSGGHMSYKGSQRLGWQARDSRASEDSEGGGG